MSTGKIVRELRKKRGWTQTELAEKVGMKCSGIATIENDKADPSKVTTIKLAEIFGVSTDYLLTGKEEAATISNDEQEVIKLYREDNQMREALKAAIDFKKKAISYLGSYRQQEQHTVMS